MATGGPMVTATEIFTLTQWFSPTYPVGAFAYSHGLEWAIDAGTVSTVGETGEWIAEVLRHGSGWNDSLFLAAAYHAEAGNLYEIDALCRALSPSAERLKETHLQGEAFCDITTSVWATEVQGLTYPVAVGRAAKMEGLPLDFTTRFYLHAFMSNLVTVAMRLVPLGQTDGQRVIREMTPLCKQVAREAEDATLDELSSTGFLSDIAAMKHETQYSRIFRT